MRRPAPIPAEPDKSPRKVRATDDAPDWDVRDVSPKAPGASTGAGETSSDADNLTEPILDDRPAAETVRPENEHVAAVLPLDATRPKAAEPEDPPAVTAGSVWAAARARRKALRQEVRRFTVRQRRRRRNWLIAGAAILVLVLGTLGAAYSPLFAVQDVRVIGTETLDPTEIAAALSNQVGTPLPLVDASEVKAALVAFPAIESYSIEARPPHELVVRIVERTPIGSIESAAGFTLVDAAGVALSTTPEPTPGFPVLDVQGGTEGPAFKAAGTVFRTLPEALRVDVASIAATTANDVSFVLGSTGTTVIWGSADKSVEKAQVLESGMVAIPPDTVNHYDVSSADVLVVG